MKYLCLDKKRIKNIRFFFKIFRNYLLIMHNNISSPLSIRSKYRKQRLYISALPFFDVLLIAFLLSLISPKFVFAPGLSIDLPNAIYRAPVGSYSTAVISVNQTNLIFFEGQIISLKNLLVILQEYIYEQKDAKKNILLVKMSKNANMDVFFNVCDVAKYAGFDQVHLASNLLPK